jgi:hypothetical protein
VFQHQQALTNKDEERKAALRKQGKHMVKAKDALQIEHAIQLEAAVAAENERLTVLVRTLTWRDQHWLIILRSTIKSSPMKTKPTKLLSPRCEL